MESYCVICNKSASYALKSDSNIRICDLDTRCHRVLSGFANLEVPSLQQQQNIRDLFHIADPRIPQFLGVQPSRTLDPEGFGVFTRVPIKQNTRIGRYGGTVAFTMKEVDERLKGVIIQRILDLEVNDYIVWIDGNVKASDSGYDNDFIAWPSRINHQWQWQGPSNVAVPVRSEPPALIFGLIKDLVIFANCKVVNDTGDIITLRDIVAGEELTMDYGPLFWGDERPRWDWTKLPFVIERHLLQLMRGTTAEGRALRHLYNKSEIIR